MQTFLPYPEFSKSAESLDNKRLVKQVVECKQILLALSRHKLGLSNVPWINHPIVQMWRGYEAALAWYGFIHTQVGIRRGFKLRKLRNWLADAYWDSCMFNPNPPWFGHPSIHASHRAALLAKNPAHYQQFNWTEHPKINYIWFDPAESKYFRIHNRRRIYL